MRLIDAVTKNIVVLKPCDDGSLGDPADMLMRSSGAG